MTTETQRIEKVGYMLWGAVLAMCLVFGMAFVGGTVGADSGDSTAPTPAENASLAAEEAESYAETNWGIPVDLGFNPDTPSFDFGLDLPGIGVTGENVGNPNESQSIELESQSVDDGMEKNANAGLCILGMDSENPSGVSMDVDSEASSVNATINPSPDTEYEPSTESAQSIVDRCSTYDDDEYR